jgi:hypothetical protein
MSEAESAGIALYSKGRHGPDKPVACYMAIGDFLILTAEADFKGVKETEGWVRRNISRFFPEAAESPPFDLISARQAIFTSAQRLGEYRSSFGTLPIASILNAFASPRGDFTRVVIEAGWIEWARRAGGLWTLGERIAEGSAAAALEGILEKQAGTTEGLQVVCSAEVDDSLRRKLGAMLVASGSPGTSIVDIGSALDLRALRRQRLFDQEGRRRKGKLAGTIAACAILIPFLGVNALLYAQARGFRENRVRYLSAIKELKAESQEDEALRQSLLDLEGERMADSPEIAAFNLISALSSGLDSGARIISLDAQAGNFTARIESPDALLTAASLESKADFAGLRLTGIQATERLERFTVTGRMADGGKGAIDAE